MKRATNQSLLFELTHASEQSLVEDLHQYFDWAYLNN